MMAVDSMVGAMTKPERVLLGRITGAHGIRGDVLVATFTADPEDVAVYDALTDADGGRPLRLKARRMTPKGLIAQVSGVSDRNGAEALKGAELWVERAKLPQTEDDEFYYADLVGLAAVDQNGHRFGQVGHVANYGAGDLLEILLDGSGRSELVPFREEFVPEVDIGGGRVVVAWPLKYEVAQPDAGGSGEEDGPVDDG